MCLLKLSFIKCYSTMLLRQCVVNNVIIKDKIWVTNHVRFFEKTFWRKVFWRKKFSSLFQRIRIERHFQLKLPVIKFILRFSRIFTNVKTEVFSAKRLKSDFKPSAELLIKIKNKSGTKIGSCGHQCLVSLNIDHLKLPFAFC